MIETAVKANTGEALRLFQRGVAAARGGQRRVAAGLLTRSIQLDPRNERTWLWLSGVLDEPEQIAFCLQSVLKINPANERALQGLRWLEERKLLNGKPVPAVLTSIQIDTPVDEAEQPDQSSSWWVKWRQTSHEMSRVRLVVWSVPIVLLCLALLLHNNFALALDQQQAEPATMAQPEVVVAEPPEPTAIPILEAEPFSLRESLTIGYFSALEPIRQQLRNATDSYLNATGQPGGASVSHVAATQTFRRQIDQARTAMENLTPPQALQPAHADYLAGLELEQEALDAILEFYGSYQVEHANRAAMRLQEANALIDHANALFDSQMQQMRLVSSISVHTPR